MAAEPLTPGIYTDLPAEEYHADPASPSLSAGIATLICNRSPLHAWTAHPRLNPDYERVEEQKFDVGNVAHIMLLDEEDPCHVVDAPDWRTNAAKEERDAARADGFIPLLPHQFAEVEAMVAAVRTQLEGMSIDPPLFCDGQPEQTLVWEEAGVTCRARLDWLRDDRAACDDLKTTSGSARPSDWSQRRLWDIGADIQVAMYLRGVKAVTGREPAFRFVVVETCPPYALSVVSLAPSALELANSKLDYALAKWRECLETDTWPSYPTQIAWAEAPTWHEVRWLEERQLEEVGA